MMSIHKSFPLPDHPGLFMVMGYNHTPQPEAAQCLADFDGCHSLTRSFGNTCNLFLYTTYPDVAENEDAFILNLGVARDRTTGAVLSAQDLLDQRLATPREIAHDNLAGNTLILCVSKREPKACIFRSVIGMYGLWYYHAGDTFICSSQPRLLMPFLPRVELSPDALVSHFLFRTVNGPTTYLQGVYRIEHGHLAKWSGTELRSRSVQDLRPSSLPTIAQVDDVTISVFRERAERMVASYTAWLNQHGYGFANLLSGGVDSSTLQYLINQSLPDGGEPRSFSYAMLTPGFAHEVEYAQSASDALRTRHEFVRLEPRDYPDLLQHTTEVIGQPVGHESMPCWVATAKYISEHHPRISFVCTGMAADTLHGTEGAKRLVQLDVARKIPLAEAALRAAAVVLNPLLPNKAFGCREQARLLRAVRDVNSPDHPLNAQGLFTDLEMVRKCFGREAIEEAFAHHRNLEATYFGATSIAEKVHVLQLTALVADEQPLTTLIYNANHLQVLFPYLDYEFIQSSYAFDPRVRFYAHEHTKPILKRILETQSDYPQVNKPKGHSGFPDDLRVWMREGALRDTVRAIERPGFMERADFERKLEQPDWFTWNMLTLDLFRKHVLAPNR